MYQHPINFQKQPWNKHRLLGPKSPFKLHEIWAIRIRLQLFDRTRDLALFNLAIDSKLRGCDLVSLRVRDVSQGGQILSRAMVVQRKTSIPVQSEITDQTQSALAVWIKQERLRLDDYVFPAGAGRGAHLSTRQYSRLVKSWASEIGLDSNNYGTHSLRRTKATLIYRKTKNLRAIQLLLGHTKLESTIRYLGVELEDALEISEQTEA